MLTWGPTDQTCCSRLSVLDERGKRGDYLPMGPTDVVNHRIACLDTSSCHLHDAFMVATVGCLVQLPEMNETLFVSFRILFHFCFIPTSFSFCFIYCFIPMILFHSFRATISFLYQSPCYGK